MLVCIEPGILVLLHLDGTIEFVGRNDDQIKIRGYRIEPVEIVMHLEEHPDVRSAFVLADRVSAEENVLVRLRPGCTDRFIRTGYME